MSQYKNMQRSVSFSENNVFFLSISLHQEVRLNEVLDEAQFKIIPISNIVFIVFILFLWNMFFWPSAIQSPVSIPDQTFDALANSESLNLNVLKRLKTGWDQTECRVNARLGQCFSDSRRWSLPYYGISERRWPCAINCWPLRVSVTWWCSQFWTLAIQQLLVYRYITFNRQHNIVIKLN